VFAKCSQALAAALHRYAVQTVPLASLRSHSPRREYLPDNAGGPPSGMPQTFDLRLRFIAPLPADPWSWPSHTKARSACLAVIEVNQPTGRDRLRQVARRRSPRRGSQGQALWRPRRQRRSNRPCAGAARASSHLAAHRRACSGRARASFRLSDAARDGRAARRRRGHSLSFVYQCPTTSGS
jgi:hypothetical protein